MEKIKEKLKYLDPFFYYSVFIKKAGIKEGSILETALYVLFSLFVAYLIYVFFGVLFNTRFPFLIVYSGSMEPNLHRGDVIAIYKKPFEEINAKTIQLDEIGPFYKTFKPIYDENGNSIGVETGGKKYFYEKNSDIVVYTDPLRNIQIVHRARFLIKTKDGVFLITKGDNIKTNKNFDQDCGKVIFERNKVLLGKPCVCPFYVTKDNYEGVVIFKIPFIGYIKLFIFDDLPKMLLSIKK